MKRMLIDFSDSMVRTAITEESFLKELIIDSKENKSTISNIYLGVVKKILPSQFVFLDIGQDKNAFLQLNDFKESHLYTEDENGVKRINLKQGQELLVQVIKDSSGTKGACVTSQLSFAGNYMVLLTNASGMEVGISKKIADQNERSRLKEIILKYLPKNFMVILRTRCEKKSEKELSNELFVLLEQYEATLEKAKYIKGALPVFKDNFIAEKAIKELFKEDIDEIVINNEEEYLNVLNVVQSLSNKHSNCVKIHNEDNLIFDHYNLETGIEKLLHKKVWLKSGGFLTIEQTEACVVIDVNTGKFEGKRSHSDTVLKTNIEAMYETCHQIRLRNLSGMIIIDFIDMKSQEERENLLQIMMDELKRDRISTTIFGMTKLGLVQLTRKKTREPIGRILQKECKCCTGTGKVQSEVYIADRIYKLIHNIFSNTNYNKLTIRANKSILTYFTAESNYINNIQKKFDKIIKFDPLETGRLEYFEIEKEKI